MCADRWRTNWRTHRPNHLQRQTRAVLKAAAGSTANSGAIRRARTLSTGALLCGVGNRRAELPSEFAERHAHRGSLASERAARIDLGAGRWVASLRAPRDATKPRTNLALGSPRLTKRTAW